MISSRRSWFVSAFATRIVLNRMASQERDIDERYLLRLGHGAEAITGDRDFSKFGRVNYMLQRRLDRLEEVKRLAQSLGMSDDVAYTCETSGHFFLYHGSCLTSPPPPT